MPNLMPVCESCCFGDHRSHDNKGKPWTGRSRDLDAFDCKATSDDGGYQCMCRANWPKRPSRTEAGGDR